MKRAGAKHTAETAELRNLATDQAQSEQRRGMAQTEGEGKNCVRISAIVDAHFSLIVDGQTASRGTRRGGAQALGLNVAQASTISLKRSCVQAV